MKTLRLTLVSTAVAFGLFGGPTAGSEAAPVRVAKPCGTLHFDGSPYGVQGRGVNCHFMRYWTRTYQLQGKHPRGWSCVGRGSYTDGGGCQDRSSKDFFEYYIED